MLTSRDGMTGIRVKSLPVWQKKIKKRHIYRCAIKASTGHDMTEQNCFLVDQPCRASEWGNTGTGYSIVCAPGEKADAAAGEQSAPIKVILVREAASCPHDVRHPQKFCLFDLGENPRMGCPLPYGLVPLCLPLIGARRALPSLHMTDADTDAGNRRISNNIVRKAGGLVRS